MIEEFFARLSQTQTFAPPPDAFDVLSAKSDDLRAFGLGEAPDPSRGSAPSDFWARMFKPPITFMHPEFPRGAHDQAPLEVLRGMPLGGERRRKAILRRSARRMESSRNWSGAYIEPERPNRIMQVMGRWTVPNVSTPARQPFDAAPGGEYHSSIWIGIDGRRGFPNESLPQIGTSQIVRGPAGAAEFGAWYQWWVRGRPAHHRPVEIMNFAVAAGDEILASLTVQDDASVLFHLKNQRTGVFTWFAVPIPAGVAPLGSTAEWVVERPTKVDDTRMYAMPDYGEVVFHDCLAAAAPAANPGTRVQQDLRHAGLIKMYQVYEQPSRIAYVSVPEAVDATRVRVAFR